MGGVGGRVGCLSDALRERSGLRRGAAVKRGAVFGGRRFIRVSRLIGGGARATIGASRDPAGCGRWRPSRVEEAGAFGGGGDAAGVALAEPAIAVLGDDVVDEVAEEAGEDQEAGEERPRKAQVT